jgi:hypothetical protein
MEIDFSSVWTWTLPLWALVVIVAFLGGVLTQPVRVLPEYMRNTPVIQNVQNVQKK